MCSSIYSGIFEAIHIDECCRNVKIRTFSLGGIPQRDACLDFHRRPYPKYYRIEVSSPKSQPSTLPLRSVTHRSLALGRTAQAPSRSLKPSTRPPDTEMGEPPKVRGLGRPSQAPSPSPNPLLSKVRGLGRASQAPSPSPNSQVVTPWGGRLKLQVPDSSPNLRSSRRDGRML